MPLTDVVILNLDEAELVSDSIARLQRERGVGTIVVVDNGSGKKDQDRLRGERGILLVELDKNEGASRGRNAGLRCTRAEYVFLLDGDILYIPGSIPALVERIEHLPDAGCVGVHNPMGMNGTQNREEADLRWPHYVNKLLFSGFPMAWTQYGVFRGDWLRKTGFVEEGVFGEAGNGYEDDWLYQEMKKDGMKSYYVPLVSYYHEAHSGNRWLEKRHIPNKNEERLKAFKEKWGAPVWHEQKDHLHDDWLEAVQKGMVSLRG